MGNQKVDWLNPIIQADDDILDSPDEENSKLTNKGELIIS
jgi:hypothetical protein